MDEETFKRYMIAARTMKSIMPDHHDLWLAYMRGLRRLYHGEIFGTDDDHNRLMHCGDRHPDIERGYRAGFTGVSPMELEESID